MNQDPVMLMADMSLRLVVVEGFKAAIWAVVAVATWVVCVGISSVVGWPGKRRD